MYRRSGHAMVGSSPTAAKSERRIFHVTTLAGSGQEVIRVRECSGLSELRGSPMDSTGDFFDHSIVEPLLPNPEREPRYRLGLQSKLETWTMFPSPSIVRRLPSGTSDPSGSTVGAAVVYLEPLQNSPPSGSRMAPPWIV